MTERESITLREYFDERFDATDERITSVERSISESRTEHRQAIADLRAENADDHLQTSTALGAVHAELRALREAHVRAEGAEAERKRADAARARVRRELLAMLGGLGVTAGIAAFVIDNWPG